ncbi:MAG: hypothetical protein ABIK10_05485 [candidate division WOR-3 bacterium]
MEHEKIYQTTCPFCLYGCQLSIKEVNKANYRIRTLEYNSKAGINNGRLCARGNMAVRVLESPQRAVRPKLNGENTNWSLALETIKQQLSQFNPNEIAVTYDINNTNEEVALIFGFCKKNKINNLSSSYLEPEAIFRYRVFSETKSVDFSDLQDSQVFLIIGNIFAKTPLIAKPILDSKYKDRNHRIYYIDSIKTRVAGFAHKFLQPKVNAEPLVLLALIAEVCSKIHNKTKIISEKDYTLLKKQLSRIYEITQVAPQDIKEVAEGLTNLDRGTIILSLDYAKTEEPVLVSGLAQILAGLLDKKKIVFLALALPPIGQISFGELFRKLKAGEIKALINFGEIFPYYYPQIFMELEKLPLVVHTSPFQNKTFNSGWALPVPSILEKGGSITTLWGETSINPVASPVSGARKITDILGSISDVQEVKLSTSAFGRLNPDEIFYSALNYLESFSADDQFTVIGEESAIGYRGYLEPEEQILYINPQTAIRNQISNLNSVKLKTPEYEISVRVSYRESIPNNVGVIPVNTPKNRRLFPMSIDNLTQEIIIKPIKGLLVKKDD